MYNIYDFFIKYKNGDFKSVIKNSKNSNLCYDIKKIEKYKYFMEVKEWVYNRYYEKGMGIKSIIKEYNLPISYSMMRKFMLKFLEIKLRKNSEITEWLRNSRRNKLLLEHKEKSGWFADNVVRKSDRGLQGYYFNESKGEYVWLRSSYEYIFAKWLDSMCESWDVEFKSYRLSDGTLYKPDFFYF